MTRELPTFENVRLVAHDDLADGATGVIELVLDRQPVRTVVGEDDLQVAGIVLGEEGLHRRDDGGGLVGQVRRDDGRRRLHEHHAFTIRLVAEMREFLDVFSVVLADAEDAIDFHGPESGCWKVAAGQTPQRGPLSGIGEFHDTSAALSQARAAAPPHTTMEMVA